MVIGAVPRPEVVERWELEAPVLSADLILRLQKYRDPQHVPGAVRELAEAVASEATSLVAAEAALWRGPVRHVGPDGAVELAGGHRFHSRLLARQMSGAREAYVVVLTVGEAIEERARAMLGEGLLAEGFLMDTAAWAALIVLAREIRRRLLEAERPAGRWVTHRVAPGYGDWPVTDQASLLAVFGARPLPVRVNEFAWMLPSKSLSGIYAVVPRS